MKNFIYLDTSIPDQYRPLFTVRCRAFLSDLLQLHNKRYVTRSICCCKCGRPLFFVVSKHRTYCDGHFCVVCSLQDVPGL